MTALLPEYENDFNSKQKLNFLSEIHIGNVAVLEELKAKYRCHWATIRSPKTGDTVAHIAARAGHIPIIEYLMKHWDYYPNITNNQGKTPLHEAAQFSQYEVVKYILANEGNPSCIKQGDWTPLMLACTKEGIEAYKTVENLLNRLETSELKCVNKDGWTALHIAARTGDTNIFDLMWKCYANIEDKKEILSKKTKNGRSLLHIACLHGRVDIARKLIHSGANVNEKDSCGQTALHESVVAENNAIKLMEILINEKANVHEINKAEMTILHLAAGHSQPNVLEYILNCIKFDPNVTTTTTRLTPMHVAARARRKDVMELLKQYGGNDSVCDKYGRDANYYLNLSKK